MKSMVTVEEQQAAVAQLNRELDGSTFNAELLEQVAAYVEQHPEEFDMWEWGKQKQSLIDVIRGRPAVTVGCVACYTVRLGNGNPNASVPAEAQRLLGIDDEQADRLFYVYNWPEPFEDRYNEADSAGTRAWIAARRFRHFIKTSGTDGLENEDHGASLQLWRW